MVYIVSDNYFLAKGFEYLLFPVKIEILSLSEWCDFDMAKFSSNDLLLIDKSNANNIFVSNINLYDIGLTIAYIYGPRSPYVNMSIVNLYCNAINSGVAVTEIRARVIQIMTEKNINTLHKVTLTAREKLIFPKVMAGFSVQDIASELGLCQKTIYAYRQKICRKFGVEKSHFL
ncbi:helix-turn-helix domain-containing protein [Enterobacter quasiroggenkampii]|uniref:helix-turn-helix domain-containing protein n=1 Tax=Enterobacter quasiroggenkampii TaxID=2497436 RepID=UPI0021CF5543|nr:helix-turn-helix transcriptional regulator [Enterobacter quasiroggenkampii]MCU6306457.1 helix-turn-helix transcriptional regulator [Enterobacter quasiroggenkampii]